MLVQQEFLKKIRDFGLNTYEAKLWTALLSRGVSTAGELSDIANVPRSRSYDVLESLEKKGFIIMKIAKPIKYLAVPPEEVVERVKQKIKTDAENQERVLDTIKTSDVLKELSLLHSQGIESIDPQEITGSIKGRNNIHAHLDYLLKESKKTAHFITTEEGMIRKYNALKKTLHKAKKKGVKVKFTVPLSQKTKNLVNEIKQVADVENRNCKGRMCLFDDKHVTFMLSEDKDTHPSYDLCVWVNSPYFASTLKNLI